MKQFFFALLERFVAIRVGHRSVDDDFGGVALLPEKTADSANDSTRSINGAVPAFVWRLLALVELLVVVLFTYIMTLIFENPFCDFMFACGCTFAPIPSDFNFHST